MVQTGFHVSGPTWDTRYILKKFRLRDFHLLWFDFPNNLAKNLFNTMLQVPQHHQACLMV